MIKGSDQEGRNGHGVWQMWKEKVLMGVCGRIGVECENNIEIVLTKVD